MEEKEKSEGKRLEEELFNKKESGWKKIGDEEKGLVFRFSDEYISFLNRSKTEREFIASAKEVLDAAALTYVAALVVSVLNLLRFLAVIFLSRRRD